ncbi:MAG: substrate-binding domain-containing protein [Clostridia bacterium]|nr:substrate-binding domain-containing protein [Clostridia bacterium]
MIVFIVLLLLSAAGLIFGRHSEKKGLKSVLWFLASLFPTAGLLYALLLVLFASVHPLVTLIVVLCCFGIVEYLIGCFIFRWFRIRKKVLPLIACSTCLSLFCAGFYGYHAYLNSIPKVGESGRGFLYSYAPTNNENILAKLDVPASLSFTEDLPLLDGATALYPVYAAFANAVYPADSLGLPKDYYWNDILEYTEVLACSTTNHAFTALVDGEADIIFCAAPSKEQLEYAEEKGEEMILTPIGRECFVFFVNSKNPIENLTVSQIRDIYSGKITRWKDLGVNMGSIRAFQRDEGSGSQSALIRFMGDTPLMKPPKENFLGDMGGIIEQTADYRNHKNAIGYSFRFYSTEMVKNNQIKLLSLEGVAPTKENIINGTYPVSDCFYAITLASNENPNVDLFIEWILSAEGQKLIDMSGYVPLNDTAA